MNKMQVADAEKNNLNFVPPAWDPNNWSSLTFNRPRDILAGIAPPTPPGFPVYRKEDIRKILQEEEK